MSAFQKSLLTSKLPPKSSMQTNKARGMRMGKMDFTPVSWNKYFTNKKDVPVNNDIFRVYTAGDTGPTLVLLHGGGFCALTWSLFSSLLMNLVECRVLAIDLRGHGDTITQNDDDLSIEVLSKDIVDLVESECDGQGVVLVGHSLGGAIAVHAAQHLSNLLGLVVIDVVEGTALGALSSMQAILRGRPHSFNTIEDGIKWSVQSGQLKNLESAKVSMPGQIKNCSTNKASTDEVDNYTPHGITTTKVLENIESISESEEAQFKTPACSGGRYTWRIDLRKTESHWSGWFSGLSSLFLASQAQKLLLLASLDRLDTDLTVAQMQGKFEVHAFEQSRGRCGHAVQEDIPDAVAEVIATYLIRNKFAQSKWSKICAMPCC